MKFNLEFLRRHVEIGSFNTLDEAKEAATKYEKENKHTFTKRDYDFFDMCFIIKGYPDQGLDVLTYFRDLVYKGPEKEWELQTETLVKTLTYRGVIVNLYDDDAGQSYYFRYRDLDNRICSEGCGSWNLDYMGVIRYTIDRMLDIIGMGDTFAPYYGTKLRFINQEHTVAELTHRLETIACYVSIEPLNKDEILALAKKDIENWCKSPEYLKAEQERLDAVKKGDRGKMYLRELIAEMEQEKNK